MAETTKLTKKGAKKEVSKNLFVLSVLGYPLILFCIFYIGVNLNSILMAFKSYTITGQENWVGLDNFRDFLRDVTGGNPYYSIALKNSLKMYALNFSISMPLYIFFSYVLFKKFFGHKVIRSIVMIPQILSGFIMCLVFKNFVSWGIPDFVATAFQREEFPNLLMHPDFAFGTNIFFGIWSSFAVSLIVYPNAMKEIDDSIIEAARIDGVNNMFTELRYIILPLIHPTLSTFIITGFSSILSDSGSVPTFYYLGAPAETINMGYLYWSQVLAATTFRGFPMLAAGGLVMTAIVAPLTLLLKRMLEKFGPVVEY